MCVCHIKGIIMTTLFISSWISWKDSCLMQGPTNTTFNVFLADREREREKRKRTAPLITNVAIDGFVFSHGWVLNYTYYYYDVAFRLSMIVYIP